MYTVPPPKRGLAPKNYGLLKGKWLLCKTLITLLFLGVVLRGYLSQSYRALRALRSQVSPLSRPKTLFVPYSTNKDCGPVVVLTPPPWNNLSGFPFLCFFLIVQTKTVAPLLFWPPPLQQPFYKQRLWPLVLF